MRTIAKIVVILCLFTLVIPPVVEAADMYTLPVPNSSSMIPDIFITHHAFTRPSEEWEHMGDSINGKGGDLTYEDRFHQWQEYQTALAVYKHDRSETKDSKYWAHVSSLERKMASTAHNLGMLAPNAELDQQWRGWELQIDQKADKDAEYSATLYEKEHAGHGCLIVTAAFGSPLAGEVQLVRDYRDGTIRQSYTGSQFFTGFNAWYYAFSPSAADYIATHPLVKSVMQVCLVPLLEIVLLSQTLHTVLRFNPDVATVCVLVFGACLYSLVYILPPAFFTVWLAGRKGWRVPAPGRMKPVLVLWILMLCGLAAGIFLSIDLLVTLASCLLVVCTVVLVAGTGSLSLSGYILKRFPGKTG